MSIIRPSSACSERRIAPRTEVSASSFWGGSLASDSGGMEMAMGYRSALKGRLWEFCGLRFCGLGRSNDGLHVGRNAVVDLDAHHVRAGGADRLLEMHLAAIELHAAGLLDRVHDVLRRDRAEQAAVVTRGLRDREHRPRKQGGVLLRALGELALGAL